MNNILFKFSAKIIICCDIISWVLCSIVFYGVSLIVFLDNIPRQNDRETVIIVFKQRIHDGIYLYESGFHRYSQTSATFFRTHNKSYNYWPHSSNEKRKWTAKIQRTKFLKWVTGFLSTRFSFDTSKALLLSNIYTIISLTIFDYLIHIFSTVLISSLT